MLAIIIIVVFVIGLLMFLASLPKLIRAAKEGIHEGWEEGKKKGGAK